LRDVTRALISDACTWLQGVLPEVVGLSLNERGDILLASQISESRETISPVALQLRDEDVLWLILNHVQDFVVEETRAGWPPCTTGQLALPIVVTENREMIIGYVTDSRWCLRHVIVHSNQSRGGT
jgi:hypothetical protein